MKRFLAIIVFAALAVAMPYVIYKLYTNDKELNDKGIDVEATIVSAEGGIGSREIKVEYKNKKGETVTAKGIINDGKYDEGREFNGKYLPDDPKTVYLPAKRTLKWLVYGICGLLALLGWGALISLIKGALFSRSVGAHGAITRAQVINYNNETSVCTVTFRRADGLECTVDVKSDLPYGTGAYVNIKYIPKGKSARVIILGY